MRLITAVTIANNYPDNIEIVSVGNKEDGYGAICYLVKDNRPHSLLLSSDLVFDNPEDPVDWIKSICAMCVNDIHDLKSASYGKEEENR